MNKINVAEKMDLFQDYWKPKILGEVNDSLIKAAKFKGEFLWHVHEDEDEMFFVVKGQLTVRFRDRDEVVGEGEFIIVPRGVVHMPVAEEEVHVLLVEAKTTVNTGDVKNERTVETLERL